MRARPPLDVSAGLRFSPALRFAALFGLFLHVAVAFSAERPNIVWIVSEDNSKHYLSLFDEAGADTPNIAALADEGILFTRAFSNSPVCSVARTTLATGCYAPRIGTQFHRKSKLASLPEGLRLFPAYLREAGYYTTNNSKKDYNCVETPGTWDESSRKATWRNRENPDQPFFHMESHAVSHESSLHFSEESYRNDETGHDPDEVDLPRYFPDTPLFRYTYGRYLDNIRKVDRIVGETVQKLEEDGVLDDTFIFYFGDHGGVLPRGKGYAYESGLHVPLVVRVPEKWSHLAPLARGASTAGFVEFVDFAPSVLRLAGLSAPPEMDGSAFLGEGVDLAELAQRDDAFGYADRFDEKYEMIRTLRVGDWKYIRSFQPYYPDGLQNNYRYRMLAYREWRDLYDQGKLGSDQRLFFESKGPELLYDLSTDPDEVENLAKQAEHQARLVEMRERLDERMRSLPDLSLFPENVLYDEAMNDPVRFGQENRERIGDLLDIANLMLSPIAEATPRIREALGSDDPIVRYWGATVCASFGEQASELIGDVRPLLEDGNRMVRVRAAEFLGRVGATDPRGVIIDVVNETEHPVEHLIALQAAAYFHENPNTAFPIDPSNITTVDPSSEAQRRIQYFSGDWIGKRPQRGGRKKAPKSAEKEKK